MPKIMHQQYVDDTILPRKSIGTEALGLKAIIKSYMEALGKKANEFKSYIYFMNTKPELENQICKIM